MTKSNGHGGSAPTPDALKAAARRRAIRVLDGCDPAVGQAVARLVRPHVSGHDVVAGFYPKGREIDITPLLIALRAGRQVVALPRTPPLGEPLSFRRWGEADRLSRERFGTMTSTGPPVEPTLLLVPLLAFDRRGHRLGYGGGYYDRTLAAMPGVRTIGCGYAALEVPELPIGPHDVPLGAIATEREFITVKAPPCASSS